MIHYVTFHFFKKVLYISFESQLLECVIDSAHYWELCVFYSKGLDFSLRKDCGSDGGETYRDSMGCET